jgi:hypothetical protein
MQFRRLTNDQRVRLFATRRTIDVSNAPARVSIGAIELELASIERAEATRNARGIKQTR